MDLLELSDDELDYELGEAAEMETRELKKPDANGNMAKAPVLLSEEQSTRTIEDGKSSSSHEKHTSSRNRKRKKIASLQDSETFISDIELGSSNDEDSNKEGQESDDEQLVKFTGGRLAGRLKRIMDKDNYNGPFEENVAVERFATILERGRNRNNRRNLKDDELEDVYKSLEIDPDNPQLRLNALYVTGSIGKMSTFDISRIFAEYNPDTVRPMGPLAFTVTFENALDVAQLLLEMSKPLRRVRKPKKMEEGELMDSSEEDEGQVKEEDGEDVAITKEDCSNGKNKGDIHTHRAKSDTVEVDVESVKVPAGKWRVITSHVPDNKLIYVRIATGYELRCSVFAAREQQQQKDVFNYRHAKIRPGLNVFDEKGNELDWDYEHDTRFFENVEINNDEKNCIGDQQQIEGSSDSTATAQWTTAPETLIAADGVKIRSRGRGAKKFFQALKDSDNDD